jgi:amino acid transporter
MKKNIRPEKLGELKATAICGNDISSSCLYVSALTILYAGQFAWISLLVVAFVLYLFRKIYGEVVGALPLNGGAYNALLNTSTKQVASFAACLTVLSYMATAVISASEAMNYLQNSITSLHTGWATVVLLLFFMSLSIYGIRESAVVATVIFITHLCALSLLVLSGVWFVFHTGLDVFILNWNEPVTTGNITTALFFGFSAAMLGISGFESSANFVEEQKPGVFPKTLRNMWAVVSFFNPAIALLVLCILPMGLVGEHKESLLSFMAHTTGGKGMALFISLDAMLVLSGAVLTSFVGLTGLVERITLDRILPNFFLVKNNRGVNYRIIIAFFILCVSVLLVTGGDLEALAGVYTFSFLTVMALFGYGNLLLKIKRRRLPRPVRASVPAVLVAVALVILAFAGNVEQNTGSFYVFIRYLVPSLVFFYLMRNRSQIVRSLVYLINNLSRPFRNYLLPSKDFLRGYIDKINSQEFVFFTKGDNVAALNRVMQYVEDNETTHRLKIVHVRQQYNENTSLRSDLMVLNRAYPDIEIEFIEIDGVFGPDLIEELSGKWNIPRNFMFIGSVSDRFPFRISELGGVRLIM